MPEKDQVPLGGIMVKYKNDISIGKRLSGGIMLASLLTIFTASGCIVADRPYYRTLPPPGSRQVVVRQFGGPAYMYSGYYNPWWAINGNFYGSPYVVNGPIAYRRRGIVRGRGFNRGVRRGFRGGRRGIQGGRGFRGGRRGGAGGPAIRRSPNRIRPGR